MKKLLTAISVCAVSLTLHAQQTKDPAMDTFIDRLMGQMTLEEKIGQMNLPSDGDIITGLAENSDIAEKIKKRSCRRYVQYQGSR